MKNATDAMKEARVPDILNLVSRICFVIYIIYVFIFLQTSSICSKPIMYHVLIDSYDKLKRSWMI